MDLGLLYAALGSRKVAPIAAHSTDGLASADGCRDPRRRPPLLPAVRMRRRSARADRSPAYPQLRPALEELSGKLPDAVMRKLNYEVDGKHRSVVQVAAEFLRSL